MAPDLLDGKTPPYGLRRENQDNRPNFLFLFKNGSLNSPNLSSASIDWRWARDY
jgi:hypothetical protein